MFAKLWKDEAGIVISFELVFVLTIVVMGLISGWAALENAVKVELFELGNAVLALNQSYAFSGQSGCKGNTAGSAFTDLTSIQTFTLVAPVAPSTGNINPCTGSP
jgi:hypothetical protein